jgi:hypothetical protein
MGQRTLTTEPGTVINIHALGATVRLEDGSLASVPPEDLAAHRSAYAASLSRRTPLALVLDRRGRHPVATVSPVREAPAPPESPADSAFEDRMNAYLKETEAWAPPDRPPPAERHFIRKKRRAAFFEARGKGT